MEKIFLVLLFKMVLVTCTCPAGTSNFSSPHEMKYNFIEDPNAVIYRALQGPVSGDIYHYGVSNTTSPYNSFLIRQNNSNMIQWVKNYDNLGFAIRSLCIDSNEEFLYSLLSLTDANYTGIYRFHTQNGTTDWYTKIFRKCPSIHICSLSISNNNVLYGILQQNFFGDRSSIIKFAIGIDDMISSFCFDAFISLKTPIWLDNFNLFLIYPSPSNNSYLMRSCNMASQTFLWSKELACTQIGGCDFGSSFLSSGVYNSNDDTIYLNLCENYKIYFFTLNANDGVPSKVYIADGFSDAYDTYLLGSQTLYISIKSSVDSANYIVVYNLSNFSFIEYKFTNSHVQIWDICYVSSNSRLMLFGTINYNIAYTIETFVDTIQDINEISQQTTQSFSEVNNSGYQPSLSVNPNNCSGSSGLSNLSFPVPSNKTMSITEANYTYLVYYQDTPTSFEYFSFVEGWDEIIPISNTCDYSNSTLLEHTIEEYGMYTAPTWVVLDQANYRLEVSIPEVTSDTEYYFRIRTNQTGNSNNSFKVVNLKVLNCEVENCDLCQSNDTNSCYTCSSDYELSGSECTKIKSEPESTKTISESECNEMMPESECNQTMPDLVKSTQTATQATAGATVVLIVAISILNLSSPICIWCIVKQFQILMLLILTRAYIPTTIKLYLSGMTYVIMNFDFIKLLKIPYVYEFYTWMIYEQENGDLKGIGIEDGSSLINNISFLALTFLFIIIHIPIALIYTCTKSKTGVCNKIISITYRFLTFTVYIRLMIESYQNILLSSISEVYRFHSPTKNRQISLLVAYSLIIVSIVFYFFVVYQFRSTKEIYKRKKYAYSQELFTGVKENNKARAYSMILITRKLFLCCFLICLQDINFMVGVVIFVLIQVIYFMIIFCTRPFTQTSNNIVETMNEFQLTVLASTLLYYNEPSRWNKTAENAFIYSITLNSFLVCLIMTISLFISIVSKCTRKKCVKTQAKKYISNETRENIAKRREERRQKDLYDFNFDHFRNRELSRIEDPSVAPSMNPSVTQFKIPKPYSNLSIKYRDNHFRSDE